MSKKESRIYAGSGVSQTPIKMNIRKERMNMKKAIGLLLICMVIFANGIFAYADTSDLQEYRDMYTAEEQRRINMITQSENSEDFL